MDAAGDHGLIVSSGPQRTILPSYVASTSAAMVDRMTANKTRTCPDLLRPILPPDTFVPSYHINIEPCEPP